MNDPLRDLLRHLATGRAYAFHELASLLNVNEALLEQMLFDLGRAGYVQVTPALCIGSCQMCDSQHNCGLLHQGRIWTVTEKGLNALKT